MWTSQKILQILQSLNERELVYSSLNEVTSGIMKLYLPLCIKLTKTEQTVMGLIMLIMNSEVAPQSPFGRISKITSGTFEYFQLEMVVLSVSNEDIFSWSDETTVCASKFLVDRPWVKVYDQTGLHLGRCSWTIRNTAGIHLWKKQRKENVIQNVTKWVPSQWNKTNVWMKWKVLIVPLIRTCPQNWAIFILDHLRWNN